MSHIKRIIKVSVFAFHRLQMPARLFEVIKAEWAALSLAFKNPSVVEVTVICKSISFSRWTVKASQTRLLFSSEDWIISPWWLHVFEVTWQVLKRFQSLAGHETKGKTPSTPALKQLRSKNVSISHLPLLFKHQINDAWCATFDPLFTFCTFSFFFSTSINTAVCPSQPSVWRTWRDEHVGFVQTKSRQSVLLG